MIRWRGRARGGDIDQLTVDEFADTKLGQFSAVARVLGAAERQLGCAPDWTIDVYHAALDAARDLLAALEIRGEDGASEAERRRVRDLDRFLLGFNDIERKDGTEELLRVDRVVLGDVSQNRRLEIEAGPINAAATGDNLRAGCLGTLDLLQETGHHLVRRERSEGRRGVGRVASPQGGHPDPEPLEKLLAAFLANDDHPLGRGTALTGGVHTTPHRVVYRRLKWSVLKNDERIAAAEFQDRLLELAPGAFGNSGAGAFAAGDRHAPNARILDQPADLIGAREDVGVGALRSARLFEDPRESQRRLRDIGRVLDDEHVADHQLRPGHAGELVVGDAFDHGPCFLPLLARHRTLRCAGHAVGRQSYTHDTPQISCWLLGNTGGLAMRCC